MRAQQQSASKLTGLAWICDLTRPLSLTLHIPRSYTVQISLLSVAENTDHKTWFLETDNQFQERKFCAQFWGVFALHKKINTEYNWDQPRSCFTLISLTYQIASSRRRIFRLFCVHSLYCAIASYQNFMKLVVHLLVLVQVPGSPGAQQLL